MLKNLNVFNNFTGLNTVFAMIMAYLLYDEISLQLTWDRNISPRSCKMSGPTQPSSSPPLNAHWTMKWHKFNIQMVQIPPDTFSETLIPLICLAQQSRRQPDPDPPSESRTSCAPLWLRGWFGNQSDWNMSRPVYPSGSCCKAETVELPQ